MAKERSERDFEDRNEDEQHGGKQRSSGISTVFIVLLAVLVLFSAAQAVQLADIRTEGIVATGAATGSASAGQQQAQVPQNLQNLPDMVGGC